MPLFHEFINIYKKKTGNHYCLEGIVMGQAYCGEIDFSFVAELLHGVGCYVVQS